MRILFASLVFVIVSIGCNPASPGVGGSAYPGGDSSAYPGEQRGLSSIPPFPVNIPTPLASKGTIIGKFTTTTLDQSLTGLPVYLGTVLPLTPGPDHMITLDLANSFRDVVREDGRFIIQDVSPGEYVLMLWAPRQASYASDPADPDREFVVQVVAGQIVDVGTLSISPPR